MPAAWPQQPASPLERYGKLEFPPSKDNFAKGWQERLLLEHEIVNSGDLGALRKALKDEKAYVRAVAARALGILADRESADALAALVKDDPEPLVRLRARSRDHLRWTAPRALAARPSGIPIACDCYYMPVFRIRSRRHSSIARLTCARLPLAASARISRQWPSSQSGSSRSNSRASRSAISG